MQTSVINKWATGLNTVKQNSLIKKKLHGVINVLTFITSVTEKDLLCSGFQTHMTMDVSILFQDYYSQELVFPTLYEKVSCYYNIEIG